MSKNPIVKAYEWLDRDVLLRQYSKVAKRWEDSGRNIYHLSTAIGIPSALLGGTTLELLSVSFTSPIRWIHAFFVGGVDSGYNVMGLQGEIEETSDSNSRSVDLFSEFMKKTNRAVRVPFFLSGAGLLGKVGYDAYNYFANGEPIPSEDSFLITLGLSNLGMASSMYLKDRDPKLLDKQPAWRKALESARERVGELSDRVKEGIQDWIPQPQPIPIPIRYQTLEDYTE